MDSTSIVLAPPRKRLSRRQEEARDRAELAERQAERLARTPEQRAAMVREWDSIFGTDGDGT